MPVTPPLSVNAPLPDASTVPAPVRLITRSLLSPAPVYCSVAAPKAIVPFATVVGAPSALAPPLTLAMLFTLSVPALIVVTPV